MDELIDCSIDFQLNMATPQRNSDPKDYSYSETKRHKPCLIYRGHRYVQDKIQNQTIYWRCVDRSHCNGRAHQSLLNGSPPIVTIDHNHPKNVNDHFIRQGIFPDSFRTLDKLIHQEKQNLTSSKVTGEKTSCGLENQLASIISFVNRLSFCDSIRREVLTSFLMHCAFVDRLSRLFVAKKTVFTQDLFVANSYVFVYIYMARREQNRNP